MVGVYSPGHNLETMKEVLDDMPQFWVVPLDVIDLSTRVVCVHHCNALRPLVPVENGTPEVCSLLEAASNPMLGPQQQAISPQDNGH